MNDIPNYIWPLIFVAIQLYSWFKTPSEKAKVNIWPTLAFFPIFVFVLFRCGFFDIWGWPQNIWMTITTISFILIGICHLFDAEFSKKNQQFSFSSFIVFSIMMWVYYSGGTFKYL